jgi:hypothetical protein
MRSAKASMVERRPLVTSCIAVIAVGSAMAGCQSTAGSASSAPTAAGASASASVKSTSSTGFSSTEAAPKALCKDLPTADVAALFKGQVSPVTLGNGTVTCTFSPAGKSGDVDAGLSIEIDATYGAATYQGTASSLGASPTSISGVGDKAVWASSQPGYGAPNVIALKGNTSCYLQAPAEVAVLTLPVTDGSQVSDAAAAAYAHKLAVLCSDIFAGK